MRRWLASSARYARARRTRQLVGPVDEPGRLHRARGGRRCALNGHSRRGVISPNLSPHLGHLFPTPRAASFPPRCPPGPPSSTTGRSAGRSSGWPPRSSNVAAAPTISSWSAFSAAASSSPTASSVSSISPKAPPFPCGKLDITLYRDDLQTVGPRPVVGETRLPEPRRPHRGDRGRRALHRPHRPRRPRRVRRFRPAAPDPALRAHRPRRARAADPGRHRRHVGEHRGRRPGGRLVSELDGRDAVELVRGG